MSITHPQKLSLECDVFKKRDHQVQVCMCTNHVFLLRHPCVNNLDLINTEFGARQFLDVHIMGGEVKGSALVCTHTNFNLCTKSGAPFLKKRHVTKQQKIVSICGRVTVMTKVVTSSALLVISGTTLFVPRKVNSFATGNLVQH